MKIRARGCTEQRDTQAFSPTTCFSKLYLVCGPPLGPWHWSHWYKISRSTSKTNVRSLNSSARLSLVSWYNRCKPNGGSIAGTLCVLLPCQQNWCLWCRPPCGAGQWSCWPYWALGRICCWKLEMRKLKFWIYEEALEDHHCFALSFFLNYVTFNFCNWGMKWLSQLSPNLRFKVIFVLSSVKAICLEKGHGTETSANKDCYSNQGEF